MAPKKRTSSVNDLAVPASQVRDPKDALTAMAPSPSLARIPSPARFALVVFSSLVMSSVLFTLTADVTQGDLGLVSKHLEEWWEVGGLVAWKAAEVGLAWVLGFDST
jgi:hypothetical protein